MLFASSMAATSTGVIARSTLSSLASDSTPHLKPVSHQCISGPRVSKGSPSRLSVSDIVNMSPGPAQS